MTALVFIGGAPGSGKSTVAALLQQRLDCPLFEFGWIPEFRFTGTRRTGYHEEADLAFENLCLVVKNYVAHDFRTVIVTDLGEAHIRQLHTVFAGYDHLLLTLRMEDEGLLQQRVLDESRSSAYRDWGRALSLNAALHEREALPGERFIDVGTRSAEQVALELHSLVQERLPD